MQLRPPQSLLPNSSLAHGHDHAVAAGGDFAESTPPRRRESRRLHGRDKGVGTRARNCSPKSRKASAPINALDTSGTSNRGSWRIPSGIAAKAAFPRLSNASATQHVILSSGTKTAIHDQPLIAHTKGTRVPDAYARPPPAQSFQVWSPDRRQFSCYRTGRVPYCRRVRAALAARSGDPDTKSHLHWSRSNPDHAAGSCSNLRVCPVGAGVEDHVIELGRGVIVPQQLCELIEGCDFDGTRARQLALQCSSRRPVWQNSAVRTNNAFAVFLPRLLLDRHSWRRDRGRSQPESDAFQVL